MSNTNEAAVRWGTLFDTVPDGSMVPKSTWKRRHKHVVVTVLAHVPVLLLLGLVSGTESAVTGATIPSTPLWITAVQLIAVITLGGGAMLSRFDRRVRTILAVTGLAVTSGALVYQSGGYIEAHFHFFVAVGIAAIYEDWLPFGIGIAYVVVTHGVFGMLNPARVYNHTAGQMHPWMWAIVHGAFVSMLAVALTVHLMSVRRSREKQRRKLRQAQERADRIDDLEERQAEIRAEKQQAQRLKAEAERQRAQTEDLNDRLRASAKRYRDAMERAADGDLAVRIDADDDSDVMAEIGTAFNGMTADIESTIADIQSFADAVEAQTAGTESSIMEVTEAAEGVSDSAQEIAAGTDQQRQMLDEISEEMAGFSASVEEVAAAAQEVTDASEETTTIAREGKNLAEDAIEDARAVQSAIEDAVETVDELDTQMETIAEITDVISEIAEQTNILALNANIEAARAGGRDGGDATDGFGVVADEVKELADETQASASDIQRRIETTQERTADVVDQVETASDLVDREIEAVTDVVDAFERVVQNADRTDSGIREIHEATDDQASSSEEVVSMIDEVAEIGETTASETRTVSSAIEEQTASMNEVGERMQTVSERTRELHDLLMTFTVSTPGEGSTQVRPAADEPATND